MKTLIISFLLICSGHALATELIFKAGFEATALVSGTATGINNTGLVLQLNTSNDTENLQINTNGVFTFKTAVAIGDTWSVRIINLPNTPQQQNCQASNTTGTMPAGGVDNLLISCNNSAWNWDQMNWDTGGWN